MTDSAADKPAADKAKKTQREAVERALSTAPLRSTGSIKLGGRKLDYKVEGAFVPVVNLSQGEQRGEPEAAVFTTAYQLERKAGDTKPRPVCFAFNGGPGSASIWLQLGALGPKRLRIAKHGAGRRQFVGEGQARGVRQHAALFACIVKRLAEVHRLEKERVPFGIRAREQQLQLGALD